MGLVCLGIPKFSAHQIKKNSISILSPSHRRPTTGARLSPVPSRRPLRSESPKPSASDAPGGGETRRQAAAAWPPPACSVAAACHPFAAFPSGDASYPVCSLDLFSPNSSPQSPSLTLEPLPLQPSKQVGAMAPPAALPPIGRRPLLPEGRRPLQAAALFATL